MRPESVQRFRRHPGVPATGETEGEITHLLHAWTAGDPGAGNDLLRRIYPELRRLARVHLAGERSAWTLGVTALVNETYLRLVEIERIGWRDRAHFFAFASTAVRRVLVDRARRFRAARRGSGERPVSLESVTEPSSGASADVLALDEALTELADRDPRQARIVEQRFFGGLSYPEIAEALGCSAATAYRQWRLARAWLYGRLREDRG